MSVRRVASKQPDSFAFTAENLDWAKAQIGKYPDGKQASAVIPLLWRAQEQHDGWLPEPAIRYVAELLGMADIRVLEVATFYTMFNLQPVGKYFVQLCGTTPCMLRGAESLKDVCRRVIGPQGKVTSDGMLSWLEVECLGACCNAPMVQINNDYFEDLTPESFEQILQDLRDGRDVTPGSQNGRQGSCPEGGPTSLTDESIYTHKREWWGSKDTDDSADAVDEQTKANVEDRSAERDVESAVSSDDAPSSETSESLVETISADDEEASGTEAGGSETRSSEEDGGEDDVDEGADASDAALAALGTGAAAMAIADEEGQNVAGGDDAPAGNKTDDDEASERHDGTSISQTTTSADTGEHYAAALWGDDVDTDSDAKDAEEDASAPSMEMEKPLTLAGPRDGKPDNLKPIIGIGSKMQRELNDIGIYHYDQIADWTPANAAWINDHIGYDERVEKEGWIAQAAAIAEKGLPDDADQEQKTPEQSVSAKEDADEVPDEYKPQGLASAREGGPDDLKRISGVGPKLEGVLHDLGVYHFDQIAAWNADNVVWVDNFLSFKGRIERDDWIGQAKKLAEGLETDFAERYDQGEVPSSSDDGDKEGA